MQTYEVIGSVPFRGYAPGEVFEAEIPEPQRSRAIARRSIRVVLVEDPAPVYEEPIYVGGDYAPVELTRVELNELAREVGVESPEALPDEAAVEAAIEGLEPEANAVADGDETQEGS